MLHTEHCTLEAPRMYISCVRHPPHSSCAISEPAPKKKSQLAGCRLCCPRRGGRDAPAGGTGVMLLHSAHRTLEAPCTKRGVKTRRGELRGFILGA